MSVIVLPQNRWNGDDLLPYSAHRAPHRNFNTCGKRQRCMRPRSPQLQGMCMSLRNRVPASGRVGLRRNIVTVCVSIGRFLQWIRPQFFCLPFDGIGAGIPRTYLIHAIISLAKIDDICPPQPRRTDRKSNRKTKLPTHWCRHAGPNVHQNVNNQLGLYPA